jgi:hypothetical protein
MKHRLGVGRVRFESMEKFIPRYVDEPAYLNSNVQI